MGTFINFNELSIPDTLSGLLRRVVQDMRIVRERDGVEFNMSSWADYGDEHHSDNPQCSVCAAGALVLAECFPDGLNNYDHNDVISYIGEKGNYNDIMFIVDSIRDGHLDSSVYPDMCNMGYDIPGEILDELRAVFEKLDDEDHYDDGNYQDVVKWFNTAAKFLESKGY